MKMVHDWDDAINALEKFKQDCDLQIERLTDRVNELVAMVDDRDETIDDLRWEIIDLENEIKQLNAVVVEG